MRVRIPLPSIPLATMLLVTLSLVAVGCDGSTSVDPSALEPGDLEPLVGEWTARSALYVSDFGERIDVVEEGGEVLITIRSGGLTTTRITLGEQVEEWHSFWTMGKGGIIRTAPLDSWARNGMTLHHHLEGDELILTADHTDFVFTAGQFAPEPASMTMVLERR